MKKTEVEKSCGTLSLNSSIAIARDSLARFSTSGVFNKQPLLVLLEVP